MDENPYQPPQSPPDVRPSHRAIAGMSLLALLVIPSAAIAGSATCFGTSYAFQPGAFAIGMGFVACLLVVVGPLALQQVGGSGIDSRDFGRAVLLILLWQIIAVPAALLIGFLGFAAVYMNSVMRQDEAGVVPLSLLTSFTTYLVSSVTAYLVWRSCIRNDEAL